MLKSQEYNESSIRSAVVNQREAAAHLLTVAGPQEEALVNSYCDIFPEKFAELVKLQLAFLVDVPVEYLVDEVHVEAPFPLGRMEGVEDRKGRKTRLFNRFGKLLHHLRRGGIGDGSQNEGPVEIPAVREETMSNFVAAIESLILRDRFALEGLFRTSVSSSKQRELESLILSPVPLSSTIIANRFSVHESASALKSALGRLSEPLLTSRFAPLFAAVGGLSEERYDDRGKPVPFAPGDLTFIGAKQVKALRLLFLLLPETNQHLLYYILSLFQLISHRFECRTSVATLGSLFTPVLFFGGQPPSSGLSRQSRNLSRSLVLMLENATEISRIPQTVAEDVARNLARISHEPVATCVRYAKSGSDRGKQNDTTWMAVAELYAEVAQWPDSERKRQAVKKLNNLNGGLTSMKSPCVDYLQRNRIGRESIRRRPVYRTDSSLLSIPGAIQLSTPVRRMTDLPSLISFSDPLSPDERPPKWSSNNHRCSPNPCSLANQTERAPLMTQ